MQTALGTDRGVLEFAGLDKAVLYNTHMTGPSNTYFNWADCHAGSNDPAYTLFLSQVYNNSQYAAAGRWFLNASSYDNVNVRTVLYYNAAGSNKDVAALRNNVVWTDPRTDNAYGRKTHVGFFRSCWLCDNASWTGFKVRCWLVLRRVAFSNCSRGCCCWCREDKTTLTTMEAILTTTMVTSTLETLCLRCMGSVGLWKSGQAHTTTPTCRELCSKASRAPRANTLSSLNGLQVFWKIPLFVLPHQF